MSGVSRQKPSNRGREEEKRDITQIWQPRTCTFYRVGLRFRGLCHVFEVFAFEWVFVGLRSSLSGSSSSILPHHDSDSNIKQTSIKYVLIVFASSFL